MPMVEKAEKIYSEFTGMKSEITDIKTMIKHVIVHNQNSSPENMDLPKTQYPTTLVPANKKAPAL